MFSVLMKRSITILHLTILSHTQLQEFLNEHFPDREAHSVLGSTFLNPTTAAGVAFGSGGTQCRKGPAYTERSLYLKISTNKWQETIVETVNTLALQGLPAEDPFPPGRARKHLDSAAHHIDTLSRWIQTGLDRTMRYTTPNCTLRASSSAEYANQLCQHHTAVNRYNADTTGPDPCRCEGKVILLATVHDTFPKPQSTQTFWLSFDSLDTALQFRKEVCLEQPDDLPISVEYMDRDAFDVVDGAGRLLGNVIRWVPGGTTSPLMRHLWNVKLWLEAVPGMHHVVDKLLYQLNPIMPAILPRPIMELGRRKNHHVMLTMGDFGNGTLDRGVERLQAFAAKHDTQMEVYECQSPRDVLALTAFRFVAAPAFRTYCIGQGLQGISVDYALPHQDGAAPALLGSIAPVKRMRYSHFACQVVHEDLAYGRDQNAHDAKVALKHAVEQRGGKLPAEHGHGTEYTAPPDVQARWKQMDPLNVLNPGIGGLSEKFGYREE